MVMFALCITLVLSCSHETLQTIAAHLHLVADAGPTFDPQLLLELIVCHHERRPSQLEAINDMPLYPTEQILWDENIVPSEFYSGESESIMVAIMTLH